MIGKLKCLLFGHKRGKRLADTDNIECPRCKATWIRKAAAKASA